MKYEVTEYHEFVSSRLKKGEEILKTLTAEKVNVWHCSTGVVGEAGELSEAVKKYVAYNKPIDRENVVEELGDLEFYMEGIRQGLGISRRETIQYNIDKLSQRYKAGYTDQAAIARDDKNEQIIK